MLCSIHTIMSYEINVGMYILILLVGVLRDRIIQ